RRDVLPDAHRVGVAQGSRDQVVGRVVEGDDGEVGGDVGADDRRRVEAPVPQRDEDLGAPGDHVVVGDDPALAVDDDTGALARAAPGAHIDGDDAGADLLGKPDPVRDLAGADVGQIGRAHV